MSQWTTDWEGVHGFNDAAAELTASFHPEGQEAGVSHFDKRSKVDDWWELTREGYSAGTTLVLVLPSYKAWGLTDAKMREYALSNLRIIPGAIETLDYVSKMMPVFVISTTYSICMIPVVEMAGIPKENLYCTRLSLDRYQFGPSELRRIEQLDREISEMPKMDWSKGASTEADLSPEMREVARRLDQIYWREDGELMKMEAYRQMIKEIKVAGGPGKAEAIQDSCRRTGNSLAETAFTDDSITGRQGLRLVRENGGLPLSVNGNEYAVREAEIVSLLDNALPLAVLLTAFAQGGRGAVRRLVQNWNWSVVDNLGLEKALLEQLHQAYPGDLPQVEVVTEDNLDRLIKQSENYRVYIRGEVGKLG
jgi:energy-converting hydrogenase A subunit R